MADVKAAGQWDEEQKLWSVEFSRRLTTKDHGDIQFDRAKSYWMALNVTLVDEAGQAIPYLSPQARLSFSGGGRKWDFDKLRPGRRVVGFELLAGNWIVRADPDAPSPPGVYGQLARQNKGGLKPCALYKGGAYSSFALSAAIRLMPGSADKAGGLVFHNWDLHNYYALELSARFNWLRLLRVTKGKVEVVDAPARMTVSEDVWHRIKVVAVGDQILCYLDDELAIRTADPLCLNGHVGLWTRGDSIVHFDDVELALQPTSLPPESTGEAQEAESAE